MRILEWRGASAPRCAVAAAQGRAAGAAFRRAAAAAAAFKGAAVAAACMAFLCVASGEAPCQKAPATHVNGEAYSQKAPARRKSPAQPAERPTENPSWLFNRANHFVMQGRCDDAIPLLENLVAKFPQVVAAKEMLSDCYLKTGRAQDAATLLERFLEENPDNFAYVRTLGLAYIDLGQKERAVGVWQRMLKDDEKFAGLYAQVAKLEQEAGLYDEAVATLRAAKKFKLQEEFYAREIIRLERILGRDEEAFREALFLVGRREGGAEFELRTVADIFRESKQKERFIAIVDSVAAARNDKGGVFRMLEMVFLIEDGRYDDVRKTLFGAGAPSLREEELYSLLNHMGQRSEQLRDARFMSLYGDAMQDFLGRYGSSMLAPSVMLMMASSKRNAARSAGPSRGQLLEEARERRLEEALAFADAAGHHRAGAPYMAKAAMFRAQVLFEDLHEPEEALKELDRIAGRSDGRTTEASELRVRILLASSSSEEAAKDLMRLAAEPDSTRALLGKYGIGKLDFITGKYGEAVKALSELAEKHPSSAWANDALELAMEIRKALPEGTGALHLYRSAIRASGRGSYVDAIDSLAALEERYPLSSLVPRAIFMKAELEAAPVASSGARDAAGAATAPGDFASSSMLDAARSDFTRLAERFPLHDLAPRALEELAGLAEREDPDGAIKQYGELMERYPDYPFMERVRGRYIALGKTAPSTTPRPLKEGQ
jgi:tetratricopeptide (TPR) repeat protein